MSDLICVEEEGAPPVVALREDLARSLESLSASTSDGVVRLAAQLLSQSNDDAFRVDGELLLRCCFALFEVGQSKRGIALGHSIAAKAERMDELFIQRRVFNMLGGQYGDIADFPSSMHYLEGAVVIARRINDSIGEAASLANAIAVLQEMGHYRQAISLAARVLRLDDDSPNAKLLKLQCASNALFAAHRIGDTNMATRFLKEGEIHLRPDTPALMRAFFERSRVFFLIDESRPAEAKRFLDEAIHAVGETSNVRTQILFAITSSVCDWANGDKMSARVELQDLHGTTKQANLYHHFVLQALVKCFADAMNSSELDLGIRYAKELVEYTTSVKKAKFYRQLSIKRDLNADAQARSASITSLEPFSQARDWFNSTEVSAPPEDGQRRELAAHEELSAIHEDMARLRARSIRRDIRTDAVDTAENWAIAAEFFDDETGQHCYRVGHLAGLLAREIGMDETFCIQVEHAARLHDIGKIAVNELILLKPGPLDASEMAAMRLHTEVGAQILGGSDDPTLKMAAEVARHHHEWWNGNGYPTKLLGRQIPLSARVCAYADVYDALTHARAYKRAWTHERALEEIVRLGGTQFDPDLLNPFIGVLGRYQADLDARAIPGFADMQSNALIASRRKLMETIAAGHG